MLIVSSPFTGYHCEESDSVFLAPSIHIDTISSSPLFSRPNNSRFHSLSLYDSGSNPFIGFVVLCWICCSMAASVLYGGAHIWMWCSRCATSAEQRGRITSPDLLTTLLMQPGVLLATFAARTRCWLVFNLVSNRTSKAFSAKLLLGHLVPCVLSACLSTFLRFF